MGDAIAAIRDAVSVPVGVSTGAGFERTTWPLLEDAARRGHQGRIGMEDTLRRPDGETAESNAELVRIALHLVAAP